MKLNRVQIVALAGAVILVAIVGYRWISGPAESVEAIVLVPPPEAPPQGALKASADHEAVFKRAFWRRPAAGDLIRNAELSEWVDEASAVSRWAWFIELEPSAELRGWLVEENPFSLATADVAQLKASAKAAPGWFPTAADGFDIHQSADGEMSLLFSREGNVLFATASGHGFTRGLAMPAAPVVEIETSGRLPLTPPPNPPRS